MVALHGVTGGTFLWDGVAAELAGQARLVAMDNVYMYGRADGRPFTEDRGYDAHTRKGRLRAAMSRDSSWTASAHQYVQLYRSLHPAP